MKRKNENPRLDFLLLSNLKIFSFCITQEIWDCNHGHVVHMAQSIEWYAQTAHAQLEQSLVVRSNELSDVEQHLEQKKCSMLLQHYWSPPNIPEQSWAQLSKTEQVVKRTELFPELPCWALLSEMFSSFDRVLKTVYALQAIAASSSSL